jgi:hypothetical protein
MGAVRPGHVAGQAVVSVSSPRRVGCWSWNFGTLKCGAEFRCAHVVVVSQSGDDDRVEAGTAFWRRYTRCGRHDMWIQIMRVGSWASASPPSSLIFTSAWSEGGRNAASWI